MSDYRYRGIQLRWPQLAAQIYANVSRSFSHGKVTEAAILLLLTDGDTFGSAFACSSARATQPYCLPGQTEAFAGECAHVQGRPK